MSAADASCVIDEMHHVYGALTVVARAESAHGVAHWECQCECGNLRRVAGTILRTANAPQRCRECTNALRKRAVFGGAGLNIKNEVGNVFGWLTVKARAPDPNIMNAHWVCECRCGGSRVAMGVYLRAGKVKTCGCRYRRAAA